MRAMAQDSGEDWEWRKRVDATKRYVVFADMLGFAELTEGYASIDVSAFEELDHVSSSDIPEPETDTLFTYSLARTYIHFQRALHRAIKRSQQTHDITSISFSDSAFIAVRTFRDASSFAVFLMRELLKEHIPARMGIAYGDFLVLRFRADVSLTGGEHAAQFLGSAVVRAHRAEQSGIKGMRILLHPSVFSEDVDVTSREVQLGLRPKYIPVSDGEVENNAGVVYEANYLSPGSEDEEIVRAVYSMRYGSKPAVDVHYSATLSALENMRLAWKA